MEAGLERIDLTKSSHSLDRIIIYGRAGIGKSRLALMLPEDEKWGEILLYAADDNSELLQSIPERARKRVHVLKPRGEDHLRNFQEFCMRDWKAIKDVKGNLIPAEHQPYRNVKTLVIDTFSTIAFRTIQQIANQGFISREEHFWVGEKGDGGFALPSRSDYQGIEQACKNFIDILFDKQRNYNIIFVCHEDSKEIAKGIFAGGPAVPGRRMLEDLPASFNTVIRLIKEAKIQPGSAVPRWIVYALTDNDGRYIAKLREGDIENGNRLGKVELETNPINFWKKYTEYLGGN